MTNPSITRLLILLIMPLFAKAQEFTADPVGDAFDLRLYGKKIESSGDNPNGNVRIILQRSDDDDDALLRFNANIYDGILHPPSHWNLGLKGNDELGLYYISGTILSPVSTAAMTFNNSAFNPYVSFGSPSYLARVTVKNELYGQKGIHVIADGDAIFGESTSPGPAIISSGVHGKSRIGKGVYGESEDNDGVYGKTTGNAAGVHGEGETGVLGEGNYGLFGEGVVTGVFGRSDIYAIHASSGGPDGLGVLALSVNSHGIYASTQNEETYAGYFVGDVYSTGNFIPSDRRFKRNEKVLISGLEIISKLRPTTFEYARGTHDHFILPKGNRYGLIAQEVEQVLPNLVKSSKHRIIGHGADDLKEKTIDFKAVNYTELIPILIAAVQEQNKVIEYLQQEVQFLKNQ